ncbi:MAG: hypothetical protein OEW77_06035 [Gemmatimonadota bacterium]|nr:hypothetical protein [Gemmatimonadota bacterium]
MGFLRYRWDAAVSLDAEARAPDEGVRFPLCASGELEQLFRDAGPTGFRSTTLEIPTRFAGFDDYWRPLLGGTGPAAAYVTSRPVQGRAALAERLRASLPRDATEAIPLMAGAWAVGGSSD